VWPCPQRDDHDWKPRSNAQDKLYFVDPLIANLTHLRNADWASCEPTALVEQQIGMAIRRRIETNTPGRWAEHDQVFYLRTPTRKEVDFISKYLDRVAIEGKYTQSGKWAGEARTVNASSFKGLLATKNVLDTAAENDHAWAVPAALLAYLIDS
jgi:predicted AAA+ superfamily ATPase